MKSRKNALFVCSLILSCHAHASGVDKALTIQSHTHKASSASQKEIDKSDQRIQLLKAEIEQLESDVKNLEVYRNHLTALVANQEQEMTSLHDQVEEIKTTRQGIVPLMYYMLDGLKHFVEQDIPLKSHQRAERISKLEALMTRADVSDAEKYRLILEAYQIEVEYGNKLGVYNSQILDGDTPREVEALHLGRVALIARSLDGQRYWYWQQSEKQWQTVQSEWHNDIETAFDVASKRIAAQMVTLPVTLNAVEAR